MHDLDGKGSDVGELIYPLSKGTEVTTAISPRLIDGGQRILPQISAALEEIRRYQSGRARYLAEQVGDRKVEGWRIQFLVRVQAQLTDLFLGKTFIGKEGDERLLRIAVAVSERDWPTLEALRNQDPVTFSVIDNGNQARQILGQIAGQTK